MFDTLRTTLVNALRGIQYACATAVIRDDDGDDGDIATPKTSFDEDF